ncbi:MAG: hypothetical protein M3R15_04775 [Acidobacteriota bacterium]|nr:hypothetical protein [Acidobacteriota bacterium]
MQKKDTTKGGHASARPPTDSAAELARHISAILNHPATPVCIYNALAEAVCELSAPPGCFNSVEYLAAHLANNIRKGSEE